MQVSKLLGLTGGSDAEVRTAHTAGCLAIASIASLSARRAGSAPKPLALNVRDSGALDFLEIARVRPDHAEYAKETILAAIAAADASAEKTQTDSSNDIETSGGDGEFHDRPRCALQ